VDIEITAFYCVCDDLLKSLKYQDHSQCRMSTAEVMTAAAFFGGDHEANCNFSKNTDTLHALSQETGSADGLPPPLTGQIH
jgi:hypothetical protein